jgi:hypothetical protein
LGIQVGDILRGELDDPRATVGDVLHDSLGGQGLERLADGHLAYAQLVRNSLLAQPLTRLQVTVQDGGSQMLCDQLVELSVDSDTVLHSLTPEKRDRSMECNI